jgi:DNA-binding HxlR family transcriptional regulator
MKDFLYENRIYYNPIEFALAHIGGTWKMPILLYLSKGPVRYGDLKKGISHISDKMLITQLRELEEKGMITRSTFREKPPRVEYALTERAAHAMPSIDLLTEYGKYLMKQEGIDESSI